MSATLVRPRHLTAPSTRPAVSAQQVKNILAELVYRLHVTRVVERRPVESDDAAAGAPTVETTPITVKRQLQRSSAKARKDYASV